MALSLLERSERWALPTTAPYGVRTFLPGMPPVPVASNRTPGRSSNPSSPIRSLRQCMTPKKGFFLENTKNLETSVGLSQKQGNSRHAPQRSRLVGGRLSNNSPTRRFLMSDTMVLIAATAIGFLAEARGSSNEWLEYFLATILSLLMSWSIACLLLQLRQPRLGALCATDRINRARAPASRGACHRRISSSPGILGWTLNTSWVIWRDRASWGLSWRPCGLVQKLGNELEPGLRLDRPPGRGS